MTSAERNENDRSAGLPAGELPAGSWPVMVTPFKEDRTIDWAGVDAVTDWYLAAGSAGLFAVAQTSEMYCLSAAERVALAERVVRRVAGRVPVVASGTFGGPFATQGESVRRMAGTGVAAVVVITSQVVGPEEGDRVLEERLWKLAADCDVPLGLYECPAPYKRLVPAEVLGSIARSGSFVFLKDTSELPAAVASKLEAVAGTPLRVYNAEMSSVLETVRAGARGFCGIAANFYPELTEWLCEAATGGAAEDEAERVQRLLTVVDAVISTPHYPASAKHFLASARGLPISAVCRTAVVGLRDHERRKLAHLDRYVRGIELPVALV